MLERLRKKKRRGHVQQEALDIFDAHYYALEYLVFARENKSRQWPWILPEQARQSTRRRKKGTGSSIVTLNLANAGVLGARW
jgi:hypothetical protein